MWVFEETLPSGEKLTDVINRNNVMKLLIVFVFAGFVYYFLLFVVNLVLFCCVNIGKC